MASIQTELSIPTQPWEAAKARFLEGLSPEEVKEFQEATLENLFYSASAAQKKHGQRSKSWIWQERLASFASGIEDYGKALDVFPNMSPMVLAPLWGSVRVVLQMASAAGKFQEMLVEMLAQIGGVLPRFRLLQKLFSNHERLLAALAEVYLDVLLFCVRAKEFFLRAKKSFIPMSIILKGAWKPFRDAFESDMIKFRKHEINVEKEADLAHMIEAAKARELKNIKRALMIQDMRHKKRHKIIASLPTVDYHAKHAKFTALRHPGTNNWIRTSPRFQSWLSSQLSDCLPCYGIPGSGKSVLAASVANDLLASTQDIVPIVCYYYCDYADTASLNSICLVASLIQQLLVRLPLDCFDETFTCPYGEGISAPNFEASAAFLRGILFHFKHVFFTIDGLEELTHECQHAILEFIDNLTTDSTANIKIFVTSRTEDRQIKRALRNHECIHLSTEDVSLDIGLFINAEVGATLVKRNPVLENERLKRAVIRALIAGAQGMFLWVKFQLYEIGEAVTEAAVWSIIHDLPRSLAETYLRIIRRAYDAGGDERIRLMRKIFCWIAFARRPLKVEELEEAVGIEKDDEYLHLERTATKAGDQLIGACRNLVVHNSSENTVTFAHHTVQQFLFSSSYRTPREICKSIFLDPVLSHRELGEICLAYLSFSDFETQLVNVPVPTMLGRREVEHMIWTEVPLAASIRRFLSWGRSQKKVKNVGEGNKQIALTTATSANPSEALANKYVLLEYIIAFWPYHAASFDESTPCWAAFEDVALNRQLMFDFRPWLEDQHQLKVSETLDRLNYSRLSLWSNSVTHPTEHQALSIYTWALGNDVKSLLALSNKLGLKRYFRETYPSQLPLQDHEEIFMDAITMIGTDKLVSMWSGEFLWFFMEHLRARATTDSVLTQSLLVLQSEMQAWANESCPSWDHLIETAITCCAVCGKEKWLQELLRHVKTSEQIARIFLSICKESQMRKSVIRQLLNHPTTGFITDETLFELAFAFEYYAPVIFDIILGFGKNMPSIRSDLVWLLEIIALTTPGLLDLAYQLLTAHEHNQGQPNHRQIPCDRKVCIPKYDWNLTAFGSESVHEKLVSMNGMDVLAVAFTQAHTLSLQPKSDRSADRGESTIMLNVLKTLILTCFREILQPAVYERRGIHLLYWAIEWNLNDALFVLREHYVNFLLRYGDLELDLAVSILENAMKGGMRHMDVVVGMPWPPEVIWQAMSRPAARLLDPKYYSDLTGRIPAKKFKRLSRLGNP